MTDIEKKALALVNEIERQEGLSDLTPRIMRGLIMDEALCRAIEQHEAFRQEVSDAVESLCNTVLMSHGHRQMREMLSRRFIIAKRDPLVEVLADMGLKPKGGYDWASEFRNTLAQRGGKIVWEGE